MYKRQVRELSDCDVCVAQENTTVSVCRKGGGAGGGGEGEGKGEREGRRTERGVYRQEAIKVTLIWQ